MRRISGELTVFFALIIAVVFALFLAVLESARTEAARLRLAVAANSSIDSLFSQYHRELWDEYRLLGLEYYADEQLSDEMGEFIKPYFAADNWLTMELDAIELGSVTGLIEDAGEHFAGEILDYMEYGIAASIWDNSLIETYRDGAMEGPATELIAELYDAHAQEAARIEEKIGEIVAAAREAGEKVTDAALAAGNCFGEGVVSALRLAIAELDEMSGLIDKYESLADSLQEGLALSRDEALERLSSGEITQASYELLDEDLSEYESYVLSDGERRQEIVGLKSKVSSDITYLEGMIEKTQEVMDYIDSYESSDEDDEGPDEEALYSPIHSALSSYQAPGVSAQYGVADEEQLGSIESLRSLLTESLLSLVLPEGANISSASYQMGERPSLSGYAAYDESTLGLIESVYIAEYARAMCGYFGRGVYDSAASRGVAECEMEYLITGEDSDEECLMGVVTRLMLIRGGLNLISLYKDSQRRSEARALAMSICGVAALTPLSGIVTFFIMSVWAEAAALLDIRALLRGERVPFIHSSESFPLSIEGLLGMAESGSAAEEGSSSTSGLSYPDYLVIFIFFDMGSTLCYRLMDVIQMNLIPGQADFSIERLAYSAEARVHVRAKHVFSKVPLVELFYQTVDRDGYQMQVDTSYSY